MNLAPEERKWLALKWTKVREAQTKADNASNEYNRMNEAFDDWCRKMKIVDPIDIADRKAPNLELNGHYATWNYFRMEADRHMNDIRTFHSMKQLGAL